MASDDQILTEINKFVTREGECEVWGGYCRKYGTPVLHGYLVGRNSQTNVRRFIWTFHKAALPDNEFVRSMCDNPMCLNINHLTTYRKVREADYTTPDDEMLEKINKYTSIQGGCQVWTAYTNRQQRPIVTMTVNGKNVRRDVQRLLWRLKRGELGQKTRLETSCSNPKCVNLEHLRVAEKPPIDWDQIWGRLLKSTRKEGECLIWTGYMRHDGYGHCTVNNRSMNAHLASFMVKTKGAPRPSHIDGVRMHVRHTCGNRGCINQGHLEYDTATRNMADRVTHGTSNRGSRNKNAVITEQTALAIKRSRRDKGEEDFESPTDRAKRFKVSKQMIRDIDRGKVWAYVPDRFGDVDLRPLEEEKKRKRVRYREKQNRVWTEKQFQSAATVLFSRIEKSSADARGEVEGPCWNYTGHTDHGYGRIVVHGKKMRAHVLACEIKSGRHRKEGEHTRHLCGNKKCVNPGHLLFGTPSENTIDTIIHGSKAAKLDADKVRDIRASALPVKELAKSYGVGRTTIQNVKSGRRWSHVK